MASVDPATKTVTTVSGDTYTGDYIVLAAGSQPNFFKTPGAEHAFPLYSLDDAERLRTRIIQAFEEADRDTARAEGGAIDFVVVGGGPTGVEVAGALSEMINTTMVHEFPSLAPKAKVHLVDHGKALLGMFADKAPRVLGQDPREGRRGPSDGHRASTEIGPGHVKLSDGSTIETRCVVWGGGLMAAPVAGASGLPQGRGGRIDVRPDFTVEGFPGVLVDRRHREHPGGRGQDPSAARLGRAPERVVRPRRRSWPTSSTRRRSRSRTTTRGRWR